MTTNTTTTWNEAFQKDYQDVFTKQVYGQSKTASIISKMGKKWPVGGQSFQITWASRTSQGAGSSSLSEDGDLATGRPSRAKNFTEGVAEYSFSKEISGKLISQSKKRGPKFFKDVIDQFMSELLDDQQFFSACRLFQDGTGLIAQVSAVNSNVLTLATPGPIWLRTGQYVGVYDNTTGGTDQLTGTAGTRAEIVDVDRENSTITLADATGAAANDYVFLLNHYDATECNGLQNLIAVQTGTVQGVNRATAGNNYAKPWLIDRGTGVLRERDFMDMNTRLSKYANNVDSVGMIVTDHDTCIDLFEAIGDRHRYSDNKKMVAGFETMAIHTPDGTKSLIPEKFVYPGHIYGLNPSKFAMLHPAGEEGGHFFSQDGQILRPMTASSGAGYRDSWVVSRILRTNMVCTDFNANVTLKNFTSP